MPAVNEYDSVADLYDAYARSDFDLSFFRSEAERGSGPLLELMAGTGRVSSQLVDLHRRVTCVDRSPRMLEILRRKLGGAAEIVCADVRALPLRPGFDLGLMPFHSFAEVTDPGDRLTVLAELSRVLRDGKRLIVTLHNPIVRRVSLDGERRRLGTFDMPDGERTLELWVQGTLSADGREACSTQRYRLFRRDGSLDSEREQQVRFTLVAYDEFVTIADRTGFSVEEVLGDYDHSPFEADSSPYMIFMLRNDRERSPRQREEAT